MKAPLLFEAYLILVVHEIKRRIIIVNRVCTWQAGRFHCGPLRKRPWLHGITEKLDLHPSLNFRFEMSLAGWSGANDQSKVSMIPIIPRRISRNGLFRIPTSDLYARGATL